MRSGVLAAVYVALAGCKWTSPAVLSPAGWVGMQERQLLLTAGSLMLIVVLPVFLMCFGFAYWFRASNARARYQPGGSDSRVVHMVIWAVPAILVVAIGYLVWTRTHALDPYRVLDNTLDGGAEPMEVDVIAQDWKWLFLYPEQHIAVVNELVFPQRRPLKLKLTSDSVMNSFFIPGLGGQIYVMAGMQTQLNLRADRLVDLVGRNTQFSGAGFAQQHFIVRATSESGFADWVARAQRARMSLDPPAYARLRRPSSAVPVTYYCAYEPGLFSSVIHSYMSMPPRDALPSAIAPGPALRQH